MPSPFDDFFPPDQLAYLRAHRDESRRPQLHGVAITFMVLSLLATALRINVRVRRKIDIKWDDYCIVIAQVMYLGMCLTMMFGLPGLGRHIITLTLADFMRYVNVGIKVMVVFYVISYVFIKLSFLFLFIRIFSVAVFKKLAWIMIAITVLWGVVNIITLFTECPPQGGSHCLNLNAVLYFMGAINIVTDLIIFSLPIPFLYRLQISTTKKLGVAFLLLLGVSVVGISIYRLVCIPLYHKADTTYTSVTLCLVNISELGVALICANLPVAYALLAESFKRWSKSMTSSRGYIATDPAGTGPANNSRSKASRPRSPTQENLSQRGRKLPSAEKIRLSPVVHSYSRQDEDNWAEDHPNHIKVDREFRVSNV